MRTKAPSHTLACGLCVALAMCAGCAAVSGASETPGAPTPPKEQAENEESLPEAPEMETNMSAYECADAFRFSTVMKRDTVRLFLPSQRLALPRKWAMDGAKYRSGPTLFWKKGQRNARLRVNGTEHPDCRRTPQRDAWVAARRRGVDLRAVGKRPGWRLDLKDETYIIFTTAPGEDRVVAPAPVPDTAQVSEIGSTEELPPSGEPPSGEPPSGEPPSGEPPSGEPPSGEPPPFRLVYDVETQAHALTVTVTEAPCRDPMSGERYRKRVVVDLDGQRYEGCGRRLR